MWTSTEEGPGLVVEDGGGTAGTTPRRDSVRKTDAESGEGRAHFGSTAANSRQIFLVLFRAETCLAARVSTGLVKAEASSAPQGMRSALRASVCYCCLVGSVCLKSVPFAVDDDRDMVASRSIRGGLDCFGSGAQRCFMVLLNMDSGVTD